MAILTELRRCQPLSVAVMLSLVGLFQAPTVASSQTFNQAETTVVDVDDLIQHRQYYQGEVVNIAGHLECLTDEFCDFYLSANRPEIIWVDARNLEISQKRRLVTDCRSPCDATIYGFVDLLMVSAWDVRETIKLDDLYHIR